MKRAFIFAVGILVALSLAPTAASAGQETPTYNQDVGPILLGNCASCHRPNQIAPMSLLSYRDARPWARAIKAKVEAREMPPWFADPRFGEFSNDTSLSDDDIATITAWADGGAPEGNGPAPTPPRFSEAGWSHPDGLEPDFVYEAPFEWQVDAEGESPNFNLYTPMPFDDARMVSATQVRPGNYAATHHIVTGLLNIPPGMKLGTSPAWSDGPVVDYTMIPDPDADPEVLKELAAARAGGTEEDAEEPEQDPDAPDENPAEAVADALRGGFGPYIPGVGADVAKPGQARAIRGDRFDTVFWNLHYQATGKPETARPSVGVWWATDQEMTRVRTLGLSEHTSQSAQLVAAAPPYPGPSKRRRLGLARRVRG